MTHTAADFLKVPEAAAELRVSEKTIRSWIEDGYLPASQPAGPGGSIRIDRRDLFHSERREGVER
ncbi:MAG: DNA-binding protein [Solirubrobacterales bacterium]|nr:DNA-binding protein [Solirubrobacterales bacterium]